jgi:hypothetical protein
LRMLLQRRSRERSKVRKELSSVGRGTGGREICDFVGARHCLALFQQARQMLGDPMGRPYESKSNGVNHLSREVWYTNTALLVRTSAR